MADTSGRKKDKEEGFLGGLMKWLNPKKEQTAIERRKAEAREKREAAIDTMFEGTGLMGAMMSPLFKSVTGALADVVAEQQDDVDNVLSALDSMLQRDARVTGGLGSDIASGSPISSGYSSMSMNGRVSKQVSLVVPVVGSKGTCTAEVRAVIDGNGGLSDVEAVVTGPSIGRIQLSRGGQYADDPDVIDV